MFEIDTKLYPLTGISSVRFSSLTYTQCQVNEGDILFSIGYISMRDGSVVTTFDSITIESHCKIVKCYAIQHKLTTMWYISIWSLQNDPIHHFHGWGMGCLLQVFRTKPPLLKCNLAAFSHSAMSHCKINVNSNLQDSKSKPYFSGATGIHFFRERWKIPLVFLFHSIYIWCGSILVNDNSSTICVVHKRGWCDAVKDSSHSRVNWGVYSQHAWK